MWQFRVQPLNNNYCNILYKLLKVPILNPPGAYKTSVEWFPFRVGSNDLFVCDPIHEGCSKVGPLEEIYRP